MNYYDEIKTKLINNEFTKKVKDYSKNKSDLDTYYYVGKMLSEAGKHYGEGIIKEYSIKLSCELNIKYTPRTLRRMRQFYLFYIDEKWSTMSTKLTWSHYSELLILSDINEINYYINICEDLNLSVRQLRYKIKSKEYERIPEGTKLKLINKEELKFEDNIKNPIVIKNNSEILSENQLQKLILEDVSSFLEELR